MFGIILEALSALINLILVHVTFLPKIMVHCMIVHLCVYGHELEWVYVCIHMYECK